MYMYVSVCMCLYESVCKVPSDISLLEEQQTVGKRRLRLLERLGLMLMPPMFHWNYTKIDKEDMRKILQRQYAGTHRGYPSGGGSGGGSGGQGNADPATDIVLRRQESIRKRVLPTTPTHISLLSIYL